MISDVFKAAKIDPQYVYRSRLRVKSVAICLKSGLKPKVMLDVLKQQKETLSKSIVCDYVLSGEHHKGKELHVHV